MATTTSTTDRTATEARSRLDLSRSMPPTLVSASARAAGASTIVIPAQSLLSSKGYELGGDLRGSVGREEAWTVERWYRSTVPINERGNSR